MIHSFLLIGQSNMAGRGFAEQVTPIDNPNIKILINGRWQKMFTPVNRDRATSGICLAESFADMYSKSHEGVEVGLIPCADGGTRIDQWKVGSLLYDHAIYMAKLALRTSTIAGVLWHQGESDCREYLYPEYEPKLAEVLNSFRRDLDLYDVPFICGGLGDFLKNKNPGGYLDNYPEINKSIISYVSKTEMTGFASAEGLTSNSDNLHFDAASLREFGLRYYRKFEKLENKSKIFFEKPNQDDAMRTELDTL